MIEGTAAARKEIATIRSGMLSHIGIALRYSVDGVGMWGGSDGLWLSPKPHSII
jgi:hypothetical protein